MNATNSSSTRSINPIYLAVILLVGSIGRMEAAAILTNQASFLALLSGGGTTYNFDSLPHLTSVTTQFPGIDFGGTAKIYNEQANPSGGAFQTAPNVLLNTTPSVAITFTFSTPVDGVGFFNTSVQDRERLTLFGVGGVLLFTGELPEGATNFLGYIADQKIVSGAVVGIPPQTLGTIFIDTFSFGQVPEPSSAALVIFGAAISLRRRTLRTRERSA